MSRPQSEDLSVNLVARACRVLEQSGDCETAALLGRLKVAIEEPERWTLSGRAVHAHPAVLVVPGDLILRVRADAALRDRFRSALAAAFDTPSRVLRDLSVTLDDEHMRIGARDALTASHPYRTPLDPSSLPHPTMLRRAAQDYATAAGHHDAAQLLSRSRVAMESPSASAGEGRATLRLSLMFGIDDLARLGRDATLRAETIEAIRAVAQGPRRAVAEVTLGPDWSLALGETPPAVPNATRHTIEVLKDLLAAEGVTCVVTSTGTQSSRLVACLDGCLGVIDVVDGPPSQGTLSLVQVRVAQSGSDLAEVARSVRRALSHPPG